MLSLIATRMRELSLYGTLLWRFFETNSNIGVWFFEMMWLANASWLISTCLFTTVPKVLHCVTQTVNIPGSGEPPRVTNSTLSLMMIGAIILLSKWSVHIEFHLKIRIWSLPVIFLSDALDVRHVDEGCLYFCQEGQLLSALALNSPGSSFRLKNLWSGLHNSCPVAENFNPLHSLQSSKLISNTFKSSLLKQLENQTNAVHYLVVIDNQYLRS